MAKEISSLDLWWRSLELKDLQQIYRCKPGTDADTFIDECDATWNEMTLIQKRELYNKFKYL